MNWERKHSDIVRDPKTGEHNLEVTLDGGLKFTGVGTPQMILHRDGKPVARIDRAGGNVYVPEPPKAKLSIRVDVTEPSHHSFTLESPPLPKNVASMLGGNILILLGAYRGNQFSTTTNTVPA